MTTRFEQNCGKDADIDAITKAHPSVDGGTGHLSALNALAAAGIPFSFVALIPNECGITQLGSIVNGDWADVRSAGASTTADTEVRVTATCFALCDDMARLSTAFAAGVFASGKLELLTELMEQRKMLAEVVKDLDA